MVEKADLFVNFQISKSQYSSITGTYQMRFIFKKQYFKFYDLQEVENNSKYHNKWTFRKKNLKVKPQNVNNN